MKMNMLLFFLLLKLSSGAGEAILNAVESLSNSGYNAMSLTIQLILTDSSSSLPQQFQTKSNTLTIFTPPDTSFQKYGQPSLSHLLLHFSPLSLSLSSLSSLPRGTKIPTLSTSEPPLLITSKLEINKVRLLGSPIYDDGAVIVFAIQDFFPANFTIQEDSDSESDPVSPPKCSHVSSFSTLSDASAKLKSRGYSIMASFLELQLIGYLKLSTPPLELTMFAPQDQLLLKFSGDIPTYSSIFVNHVLPCRLTYADLNGLKNGTVFKDNFQGFSTIMQRTDTDFFVNGVQITFPDMYSTDWLVIHGIDDVIMNQPDDTVLDEAMKREEEEEEDEKSSVSSVSYSDQAPAPDANEL